METCDLNADPRGVMHTVGMFYGGIGAVMALVGMGALFFLARALRQLWPPSAGGKQSR